MRILVLGHTGMLGRAVAHYFSSVPDVTVLTTPARYGTPDYLPTLTTLTPDYIINCIGKIPQRKPESEQVYDQLNTELPLALDTLGIPVVFPTTDCEFKGALPAGAAYRKTDDRDAEDAYGLSKARASAHLEAHSANTKIIRTSIIGHELSTAVSLLDWFLIQTSEVRGYTNHYWNGLTTLEWAKQCHHLMVHWNTMPTLNQLGTAEHHSKFDVFTIAKAVYQKDITIVPFATPEPANKCLVSDYPVPTLEEQLEELRVFFKK